MSPDHQNTSPAAASNAAQLVNPPTGQTKMVSPQKPGQKTYKIVALRPFQVGEIHWKEGRVDRDETRIVAVGEIVEVSKEQAKDLCKPIKGSYAFSGERHNADRDVTRHDLSRARLAVPADLVENKPLTPIDESDIFEG